MRWSLAVLLLLILPFRQEAQELDCDHVISEDSLIGNSQLLRTRFLHTIARTNYSYYLSFRREADSLFLDLQTANGGELGNDDEIIFVGPDQERRRYRFTSSGKVFSKNSTQVSHNFIKLDLDTLKWFASVNISTLLIVDHDTNRIRKLSPGPAQQDELMSAAKCFLARLTPVTK